MKRFAAAPTLFLLCAAALAALRLGQGGGDLAFDFRIHYDIAAAIVHGEDAFARARADAVTYPALGVLYAVFLLFSRDVAGAVFFAVNACALFLFLALYLGPRVRIDGQPIPPWAAAILAALILNSAPVLQALRLGQSPILTALLLSFAVLRQRPIGGPLALAAGMALKTNFGGFVLPLLAARKVRLCLLGLAAFLFLSAAPLLFGGDLARIYTSYLERLRLSLGPGGVNNPTVNGADLLDFELFRTAALNTLCKAAALALLVAALLRDHRLRRPASLNTLLLAATVTLCIVYHRKYDAVLLLPLLGLLTLAVHRRERSFLTKISAAFLSWFLIPESLLLKLGEKAGGTVLGRPCITSPFRPAELLHVLPLNIVLMLALLPFAAWIAFREPPIALGMELARASLGASEGPDAQQPGSAAQA